MSSENFSISYMAKGKLPDLPFCLVKDKILGKKYTLSVAVVTKRQAEILNKQYRNKDYTPNILSFPLTSSSGEIIIHLPTIKKQYKSFEMTHNEYILYIFIHGCVHLLGHEHGKKMSLLEQKYCKQFSIPYEI